MPYGVQNARDTLSLIINPVGGPTPHELCPENFEIAVVRGSQKGNIFMGFVNDHQVLMVQIKPNLPVKG